MMDCLDSSHPALRASPALYALAWREALRLGLGMGATIRAQLDPAGLGRVIGRDLLLAAFPSLGVPGAGRPAVNGEVVCQELLDDTRRALLLRLLELGGAEWSELPLFYIDPAAVLDDAGHMVLRVGDDGDALLFSFSPADRDSLLAAYAAAGLPADVVARVDVNPAQLGP